jgi:hypothetical protein
VYVELLGLWPDNEEKGLGSEGSVVKVSMLGNVEYESTISKINGIHANTHSSKLTLAAGTAAPVREADMV